MPEEKKIVEARIIPRASLFDSPKVMVKYEGSDEEEQLFEFYEDEISFSSSEFIGLTRKEGSHLKFVKDKAYLQS